MANPVDDEIVSFDSALKEVVVCASKYRFIWKKKPSNKLTASILKDCRLENRVQQTSANICDHGEGFVEAILFLGEKNDLTISLIDSTCFFSL